MSEDAKFDLPEVKTAPQPPSPSECLIVMNAMRGGVVLSDLAARCIAEALLTEYFGDVELARQRPLLVEDLGDNWRIEGSFNRDYKLDDMGPVFVTIWKWDGRIVDFGRWGRPVPLTPEVRKIIEEHQRSQQTTRSK